MAMKCTENCLSLKNENWCILQMVAKVHFKKNGSMWLMYHRRTQPSHTSNRQSRLSNTQNRLKRFKKIIFFFSCHVENPTDNYALTLILFFQIANYNFRLRNQYQDSMQPRYAMKKIPRAVGRQVHWNFRFRRRICRMIPVNPAYSTRCTFTWMLIWICGVQWVWLSFRSEFQ